MIRLFAGFDPRESIGFHVFAASVIEHASAPVAIHPLGGRGLPHGTNAFTYARFLVPYLCNFEGWAIFADGCDMLMQADIYELDDLADERCAVQVVQHREYRTRHRMKYRGTTMQCPNRDYPRKNWASLMLMNCRHPYWRDLTPDTIDARAGLALLQFEGCEAIGALPDAWNRLVDEGQPVDGAKLLHYTAGIPAMPLYADGPGSDPWHTARRLMEFCA